MGDRSLDGNQLPKGMEPEALETAYIDKPEMPQPSLAEKNYAKDILEAIEEHTDYEVDLKFVQASEEAGAPTRLQLVFDIVGERNV